MEKTIVFIHGMFENSRSWEKLINYFENRGYKCFAPDWSYHQGKPSELRKNVPEGLGELRLQSIIDEYRDFVTKLPSNPILIGHSVGGLVVQTLVNEGIGELGVCISTVAPNAMFSFDWGYFKNSISIMNPLEGDKPFIMTLDGFHDSFCNTMTMEETRLAYETYATDDSRNVLRDCLKVSLDLDKPHVPLLFINGENDQIVPPELAEKNSAAYTDKRSQVNFKVFPNRGHFIANQPGWEEVAAHVADWVSKHEPVAANR